VQGPIATPTSFATAAGTASATPPQATATSTAGSDVLGAVTPTGPRDGGTGSDRPAAQPDAPEPQTSAAVLGFDQISKDPGVIGTNLVLAIILLIVLLATSAVFNDTLNEHRVEMQALWFRLTRPLRAIGGAVTGAAHTTLTAPSLLARIVPPVLVLGLSGLVYTFNEPGVGFDGKTTLLFMSLVIAIGVTTYLYEGGEALVTERRFGIPASVQLFPVALAFAVGFVIVSRLTHFEAPIMYGFVASATVLAAAGLRHRDSATAVLFPAVALLGISIAAWLLLVPLREISEGNNRWWVHLPGASAALIFAAGIEGLLFVMLPIRFTDGEKIWRWYRWLWFPLFFVPAFLFAWVIMNPEAEALGALLEGRVLFVSGLVGAYVLVTLAIWLYFYVTERGWSDEPKALPPGGQPAEEWTAVHGARAEPSDRSDAEPPRL
jgi:hypothetical protein